MEIKDVEKKLNVPRTHIRYLQREGLFTPSKTGENGYRDFSEEDIQELEMILILMKAGVTANDVAELQKQKYTLEDILSKTEADMRIKAEEILGSLELIQQLRASCVTYDSLSRDTYWEEIQRKESSGQRFLGHYELEDISEWAEPQTNLERIVYCPNCKSSYRIDLEEFMTDEYSSEKDMGLELYRYFVAEECICHSCKKFFKVFGHICEYPAGVYDSEDINVTNVED